MESEPVIKKPAPQALPGQRTLATAFSGVPRCYERTNKDSNIYPKSAQLNRLLSFGSEFIRYIGPIEAFSFYFSAIPMTAGKTAKPYDSSILSIRSWVACIRTLVICLMKALIAFTTALYIKQILVIFLKFVILTGRKFSTVRRFGESFCFSRNNPTALHFM